MARYRTFKPELFADEKLTECSVDARFLFLGLLPFLDDMGRRQYHPRRIKAEVFPADDEYTVGVVEGLVQELAKVGVIELYDIGRNHYIRVPKFSRHQYVKKPTHCYVPPSPSEGPDAVRCNCLTCKSRLNRNGPHPTDISDIPPDSDGDSSTVPVGKYRTSGTPVGNQYRTSSTLVPEEDGQEVRSKGIGIVKGEDQHQHQEQNQDQTLAQDPNLPSDPTAENRRARQRALDGIATQMLVLLKVPANPLLLDTLTKSITTKARTRNTSVELAGQHILAKAALYAVESPPEDWRLWFEDVRYDYVPQGDKRINNGRFEARPVCGGSRCSDGWEMVKVGDSLRLRRCPDCEQLWRDMGV